MSGFEVIGDLPHKVAGETPVVKRPPTPSAATVLMSVVHDPANFDVAESSGVFTPQYLDQSPLELVAEWWAETLAAAPPLHQLGLKEHVAASWHLLEAKLNEPAA